VLDFGFSHAEPHSDVAISMPMSSPRRARATYGTTWVRAASTTTWRATSARAIGEQRQHPLSINGGNLSHLIMRSAPIATMQATLTIGYHRDSAATARDAAASMSRSRIGRDPSGRIARMISHPDRRNGTYASCEKNNQTGNTSGLPFSTTKVEHTFAFRSPICTPCTKPGGT